MKKFYVTWIFIVLALSALVLPGCGDVNYNWDLPTMENPKRQWSESFQLDLMLDASFQESHAGHDVRVAVVRSSDGAVVAVGGGRISAGRDPSFTFSAGPVFDPGVHYAIHYWIDSNIGGGTRGVCDDKKVDHQWSIELFTVFNDKELAVSHNDTLLEDICGTFE